MLLQITASHFTAGLFTMGDEEKISLGAPIVAYMQGWSIDRVKMYCQKRGWKLEIVNPN